MEAATFDGRRFRNDWHICALASLLLYNSNGNDNSDNDDNNNNGVSLPKNEISTPLEFVPTVTLQELSLGKVQSLKWNSDQ